jgi:hypothetical protein
VRKVGVPMKNILVTGIKVFYLLSSFFFSPAEKFFFFKIGKMHGYGTYEFSDGAVYEGQWYDGKVSCFSITLFFKVAINFDLSCHRCMAKVYTVFRMGMRTTEIGLLI